MGWKHYKTSIIFVNSPVWSEPLWDGNPIITNFIIFCKRVWSEPLWDGNSRILSIGAKIPRLIRTIVGWKQVYDPDGQSGRCVFDPNHCGMETFWKRIQQSSHKVFDPNHCGMETLYRRAPSLSVYVWSEPLWDGNRTRAGFSISYYSLIRTIVGWKHHLRKLSHNLYCVWSEPLWDGNIEYKCIPVKAGGFDPNHCGMETLW